jgi:hypothetical protein
MRACATNLHKGVEGSGQEIAKDYVKRRHHSLITGFVEVIPTGRCSLCFSWKKPFRYVTRPTGPHSLMQKWPYCEECFREFENPAGQAGSK